jgi:hypothetical protein
MIAMGLACSDCCPWKVQTTVSMVTAVTLIALAILYFANVKPFDEVTLVGGALFAAVGGLEVVVNLSAIACRTYHAHKKQQVLYQNKPWLKELSLTTKGAVPYLDGITLWRNKGPYPVFDSSFIPTSMASNEFVFYFPRGADRVIEEIWICVGQTLLPLGADIFERIRIGQYVFNARNAKPNAEALSQSLA